MMIDGWLCMQHLCCTHADEMSFFVAHTHHRGGKLATRATWDTRTQCIHQRMRGGSPQHVGCRQIDCAYGMEGL